MPLTFVNVWDPTAERIFDLGEISDLIDQPERWLPIDSEEVAAMLIPNSTEDRLVFQDGRYGVVTGALSSGAGDDRRAIVNLIAQARNGGACSTPGTQTSSRPSGCSDQ